MALLCGFLLPAFNGVLPVQAQDDQSISLLAQVGFDGFCKDNHWLPVHIIVENSGTDLEATVQISTENNRNGMTIASTEISLPNSSRKDFFLYIYPDEYSRDVNVSVLDRNRILKKSDLRINCTSSDDHIFGLLTENPSTYNNLIDVRPLNGLVRVAQLEISDLPNRDQAWTSLDALVISSMDTGTISQEQKQALTSWIAQGGKLLVTGGPNWQITSAGLKNVLPMDPTGTRYVNDLTSLQEYMGSSTPLETGAILTTGSIREGAQILVEQNGYPVVLQKPMGLGTVYYITADPSLQPLSDWGGIQDLYTHLLGFKARPPTWADGFDYAYSVSRALATIPELGLPSILYICGLLTVYVLVIGPVNYFVLRRMKRTEIAWITIPGLVILFTGLAYVSGFLYRGTTPILNRLIVAQAWDGVDQANTYAMVGVYSPVRTKYELVAGDGFMFQPLNADNGNLQNNNWFASQDGPKMTIPDVRVEIGGMKTVAAAGNLPSLDINHNLTITINNGNPVLSGTITNASNFTLKDAFLVTPGDWRKLGDLPSGASQPINTSLSTTSGGAEFYRQNVPSILNYGYTDIRTDQDVARRSAFLEAVLDSGYNIDTGNWGIYLAGWVDQPIVPIGLQDRKFKTIDTMLYFHMLTPAIKMEPGPVKLPISLFTWVSSNSDVSAFQANSVPQGGYTLKFRPAIPIKFGSINSFNVTLTSNPTTSSLVTSAWDYENETWVPILNNTTNVNIIEAGRFVGPDGEIGLKIVNTKSDWVEITGLGITLTVIP